MSLLDLFGLLSESIVMAQRVFSAIILAAGKGTRMKSPLPKVLHPVAGSPMVLRTVEAVLAAGATEVRVVVGFGEALVRQVVEPLGAVCFKQHNQWGTGDAVRAAEPDSLEGTVLILNGDHPLLEVSDIEKIVNEFEASHSDLAVVTCELDDPGAYGRVVRHHGRVMAIVEAKDASHETKKIKEINTGIYVTKADTLHEYLPKIQSHNAQKEYYLTDVVSLCIEGGDKVTTISGDPKVAFGVNSQAELAQATATVFRNKVDELMDKGVIVIDPQCTYVEESVEIGEGSVIYPGCYLKGKTKVGQFCVLEPNCFVDSCVLADSVHIKAGSYLEYSEIKSRSEVGPYAHLRPKTEIGEECKIGNFVEMKKVKFGDRSKASHLTYLGDAIVGKDVNVGCGTITCNYAVDHKKYVTKIGDGVFVGSDSQFVAPVEVGEGAVIASGSTITKNVPAGGLAIARGRQIVKENYRPMRLNREDDATESHENDGTFETSSSGE